MVQIKKKIALLHRYPKDRIRETNAAFPYLETKGFDILTFKNFNRQKHKLIHSILWVFYAPTLVYKKNYDVIYCDDSFPFYPILVKLASPKSKLVIRIGDFHLMYYFSGWKYKFLHFFEKIGWRLADTLLSISHAMKDQLSYEGFDSTVVPDPVEPANFMPDYSRNNADNIVMFHGLINKNKNVDLIIKVAHKMPTVWFWVVGDGPDLERLRSIAPKNVVFSGWCDHSKLGEMINKCSIGLALRSENEGNQYVITSAFLQYAAAGKPCLVTRRKVFGNYKWQFFSEYEMIAKIKLLLISPNEGKKIRKKVLNIHNAKKVASKICKILLSQ